MNKLLILVLIAGELLSRAYAQQNSSANGPVPKLPFHLPPGTQCITQMSFPKTKGTVQKRRILVFSGQDACRTDEMSDGRTKSTFIRSNYYLSWDPEIGPQITPLNSDPMLEDFRKVQFPELDWVKDTDNKGITNLGNSKCLLYEKIDANNSAAKRLYVSVETLRPIRLETSMERFVYSYDNSIAPGSKIPLPPPLQERWEKVKINTWRYLKQKIED